MIVFLQRNQRNARPRAPAKAVVNLKVRVLKRKARLKRTNPKRAKRNHRKRRTKKTKGCSKTHPLKI